MKLNLVKEVVIDIPSIVIPWGIDEETCKKLAPDITQEVVSDGYTQILIGPVTYLGVSELHINCRFDLTPKKLGHIQFAYAREKYNEKLGAINERLEELFGQGRVNPEEAHGLKWNIDRTSIETFIFPSAQGEVAMLLIKHEF